PICLSHTTPLLSYFYVAVCHRYLPSFPTRRSSDLPDRDLALVRKHRGGSVHGAGGTPLAHRRHGAHSCRHPDCRVHVRGDRRCRDRKSTRLNSSHEWISYAVFCLKKKTKT